MKKIRASVIVMCLALSGSFMILGVADPNSYTSIYIYSDNDFDAQHGVISGSGTSNDPYIITGNTFYDITIKDTTKYFKLYDFNIYSQIYIENAAPYTSTIENIIYDNGRQLTNNGESVLRLRNSDYPKILNCIFINWTNAQTAAHAIVLEGTSDGSLIRNCTIYCGARPNTYSTDLGSKGHHLVENCIFKSTAVGIIVRVENSSINNCTFIDTFDEGLYLSGARNVSITDCDFRDTADSIEFKGFQYLPFSEIRDVILKGCNLTAITFLGGIRNCVIEDNYFSKRPMGIIHTGDGVVTQVKIRGNTFNMTDYGIALFSNEKFTENEIYSNHFINGYYAFCFSGDELFDNLIYNNDFSDNLINGVYSEGNGGKASDQIWNISKTLGTNIIGGPYLGGNYWPDYSGIDMDGDGLGDTNIPHHGLDYLPLTDRINNPPNTPDINGPSSGKPGTIYTYTMITTDPDNDNVYYYVDWGDNTNSGWLGPYISGAQASTTHSWNAQGTYTVKLKAKDVHSAESDWRTLSVTMPLDLPGSHSQQSSPTPQSQPSIQPSGQQVSQQINQLFQMMIKTTTK